jgi:hypothetical protein
VDRHHLGRRVLFEMHVHHLLAAIYAGIVDVGLVVLGQAGWSARGGGGGGSGGPAAATTRRRK